MRWPAVLCSVMVACPYAVCSFSRDAMHFKRHCQVRDPLPGLGRPIFAESRAAMDGVQERAMEELYDAEETHAMAFMDLQEKMSKWSDQEVVDEKCRLLKGSGAKFNEAKRKAEDAQGQVMVH